MPFRDFPCRQDDRPLCYEELARQEGYEVIAGVDEAGRGPLAGPVVAGAVVLPGGMDFPYVRDSKQMTARQREEAFTRLQREALATGIGVVSSRYIDEHNILNASLEAMVRAVGALDPRPDFLLVDGIHAVPVAIPQRCIKRGDQLSRTVSAASILAKVYRDRIMLAFHRMYPSYDFAKNKGYGTAEHLNALRRHGPSPIHRLTFRGVKRD